MQTSKLFFGAALAFIGLLSGCTPSSSPGDEPVAAAQGAVFANGSFETGTAGNPPPSWTVQSFINNGITVQTPQTRAGLNLAAGGNAITTILNGTNQPDPDLGVGASLRYCRYGAQCARVNFHSNNANNNPKNVNSLSQDMLIAAGDVDPIDNQVHIRFAIAPVLQNPAHAAAQQPYYFVQVTNLTTNTILYTDFNLSAQAGVSWKTVNGGTMNEIDYVDWTLVDVAPGAALIAAGNNVRLEVIAGGCSLNGHFGEIYLDGVGTTVPGLYIAGTGPAQANPGALVTYNLTYKNGSAAPETGVTINLTTPPNTTFASLTPPANATCTPLAVGATGTITCTISGSVAAGASSSFTYAVNLSNAATGQLLFSSYDIHSNEETTLVGSKITTTIGCTADAICGAGKWCNISGNQCLSTLANGTTLPSDPPHANPALTGACTATAAALVCTSAVCETTDSKCGKLNGNGTCTLANQGTICRSAVCDSDGLCGYANSHGPCSAANGATVCRSGSCSANLLCQPLNGCNVDADCAAGNWCNEANNTCAPKLTNGTAIPSDPPHTNPILNALCTAAAGSLVCQALVCDASDNKCGYNTNGGPCTMGTAATVCRSSTCSTNGLCRPLNGCNVDADCSGGQWCAEATHVCTAKLANGVNIPVDAPHTNPALTGACTAAAGTLVCQASVCDTDSKCGKKNGSGVCTVANQATICRSAVCDGADNACGYDTNHGPCSAANAATVCRSGTCSSNLLCQPAGGCNVDVDCPSGQWCNETNHVCSVKLTNGTAVPSDAPHANPTLNGTCSAPAATLVCQSAVCDAADNKCGYGTNGGPCTVANQANVCRSGSCSANGSCKPSPGCNVDADCTAGNWCNETLHACTATLANNTAVPTDAPHTNPTLNGTCSVAAGTLVCQSGVCDTSDNRCGYDKGNGPCTAANGAVVCRSGACGLDLKCRPTGGCNVDGDCSAGNWCEESSNTCKPKLANGSALPNDAPHTSPTLDGNCTTAAATLVCQSAVCDTADDQCGFAAGHGPCTALDGATVCRSAKCSADGGVCLPADGCNGDGDCAAGKWCNETTKACLPTLDNGIAIPTDTPHTSPALDGTCTDDAATLVCSSGVCDMKDNQCGLSNGVGPCTAGNAQTVCRSGRCGAMGASLNTCVACTGDDQCSGDTPLCNTASGVCVNCLISDTCTDTKPICDLDTFSCTACDGDNGSKSAHACATKGAPFCFTTGKNAGRCGLCATNDDCSGRANNVCDPESGLCVPGCLKDGHCTSSEWCDDGIAMCTPKLPNGTPLPSEPERVATCTTDVGSAVCESSVCDPADNTCGLAPGHGDCTDDEQCRAGTCDATSQRCTGAACTSNDDCPSSEFCTSDNVCSPLLPTGAACAGSAQCQSHDCFQSVCNRLIASGNGVACSVKAPGSSSGSSNDSSPLGLFAVALAVAALSRKRGARAA